MRRIWLWAVPGVIAVAAASCSGSGSTEDDPGAAAGAGGSAGGGGSAGAGGAAGTGGTAGAGGSAGSGGTSGSGGSAGSGGAVSDGGAGADGSAGAAGADGGAGDAGTESGAAGAGGADAQDACGGACPSGYTCGTANGLAVCRAASGVPLVSHLFVIVMENTSLSTLQSAIDGNSAPNLKALAAAHATGSDYHGVAHPSLPNYIALTSGDTQGIACDCQANPNAGGCNFLSCSLILGSCGCNKAVTNLADQLETASRSWMAYGENMGTACNITDNGTYAVRHIPFLYYDDVRTDSTRCAAHVVDFNAFDPASAADFTFIAPNLVDDMHDPSIGAGVQNVINGDSWIGPHANAILASAAYAQGGMLVVVWDEDDGSGGILGTDDPIGIFVMSPYAKNGGFVSAAKADHYSLLATIEDSLGLPRLGKAGTVRAGVADTLSDYFPPN